MRESSACLMRSFSQPSPTSSDEKKRHSLHRALTTSVSFGRFMSESLDWEKWSAFTHNRYLEEVERYSKPGSVAEKKAYFEAHFKRRRAAALLEQQNALLEQKNALANDVSENNTEMKDKDNSPSIIQNTMHEELHNNVDHNYSNDYSTENKILEECLPEGENKEVPETFVPTETAVEITKHLENAECNGDILSREDNNSWHEDDSSKTNSTSLIVKKSEVSSSILSANSGGVSECASSVEEIMHTQTRTSVKTSDIKKKAVESSNKRRSHMTSLHMSINFDSCSQKATFPGPPKITANPRPVRAPIKKYKNSTVAPQASTRASVRGVFKHLATAPPVENRRTVTAGDSTSARRTVDLKLQSSSPKFSKSSNTLEGKTRLPTASSPFQLKSEERAAKRKEFFQKLEEKLKLKEAEKHERAKSQVNSRSNFKELRNSIVSKAIENAEPSPRIKLPPCYFKKKVPIERSCFPKVEEMPSFKVEDNDSRHPSRLQVKTQGLNDVAGKNHRHLSGKHCLKKTNENASPNIWRV